MGASESTGVYKPPNKATIEALKAARKQNTARLQAKRKSAGQNSTSGGAEPDNFSVGL